MEKSKCAAMHKGGSLSRRRKNETPNSDRRGLVSPIGGNRKIKRAGRAPNGNSAKEGNNREEGETGKGFFLTASSLKK